MINHYRPRKPKAPANRDLKIYVRLTPDEMVRLDECCAEARMTRSGLVRTLLHERFADRAEFAGITALQRSAIVATCYLDEFISTAEAKGGFAEAVSTARDAREAIFEVAADEGEAMEACRTRR